MFCYFAHALKCDHLSLDLETTDLNRFEQAMELERCGHFFSPDREDQMKAAVIMRNVKTWSLTFTSTESRVLLYLF